MNVIALIIPLSILLGVLFVVCFIIAARSGQYDDLDTPAYRLLIDEENKNHNNQSLTAFRGKKDE